MKDRCETRDEEVLTDVAKTLVDQVILYGRAKEIADKDEIKAAIQDAKTARAKLLHDLNAQIWRMGVAPIAQGTLLGSAHKVFLEVLAVLDKDDRAALREVERGEAYLREKVEKAVHDEALCAHTRNYLATVLSRIDAVLEDIRAVHTPPLTA